MNETHGEILDHPSDAISDDAFREQTLRVSLHALRRRKRASLASRVLLALIPPVALAAFFLSRSAPVPAAPEQVATDAPPAKAVAAAPESQIKILTDDELLAIFTNRPVALIGEKGHRTFVFLDEARAAQN